MSEERPAIGQRVLLPHTGEIATVVPTGKKIPLDEVNVMIHITGSVRTVPVRGIELIA